MTFRPELLDELLKNYKNPEDLVGEGGILKQLTAALVERCLNAEMDQHLEEERAEPVEEDAPRNRRNGHSKKTVKGEFGEAEISIPRDRNGAFEPVIVAKGQTRFDGFDGKILSLYSRGMSVRDIQAQLQDLYGVEVSAGLISKVTDAVEEERKLWQNRGLDRVYPIVYFDAIVVKVRQDGRVINKAIHLALGVNLSGNKELLGMWMTQNESAKFWLSILTELQQRGLKDAFIACCDGLTGFPDAIEAYVVEVLCRYVNKAKEALSKHSGNLAVDKTSRWNLRDRLNWMRAPHAGDRALPGKCLSYPAGDRTNLYRVFHGTESYLLLFLGLAPADKEYAYLADLASKVEA